MADSDATSSESLDTTPAHPDEMSASFRCWLGNHVSFEATARITPAGMIAVGLSTAAILLAFAAVVRARR